MKLLILPLLISLIAHAGNRVGNGGDVLVCEERKPAVQLLDMFEAEDAKIDLIADDTKGTYEEILRARLDLLTKVAPKLGEQYKRRLKSIKDQLNFKEKVTLTDVKDSLHAIMPSEGKCKLNQIVIRQAIPTGDSEKKFLVDKGLWEKLSSRDRAALILHEIVYEHFTNLGDWDSRYARKLNGLIFSKKFESMESGKFWLFIKEFELPLYP